MRSNETINIQSSLIIKMRVTYLLACLIITFIAGQKFGDCNLTTVVNAEDTEIDDVNVIRDGDHLFFLSSQCRKTDHQ